MSEDGQLICSRPDNSPLKAKFFYGCGMPETQMKEEAGTSRRSPLYKFMEFFGQETMTSYGVQF